MSVHIHVSQILENASTKNVETYDFDDALRGPRGPGPSRGSLELEESIFH